MADQKTQPAPPPGERGLVRPCVVISQPMYFPWRGLFEQIRLADIYVDYNDVQFARGGFVNRVQIKTEHGIRWLTVPLQAQKLGQLIREVRIDAGRNWQGEQLNQVRNAYRKAPFLKETLQLMEQVFEHRPVHLGELAQSSIDAVLDFYPTLRGGKRFLDSHRLAIPGNSTARVKSICESLEARTYLTGHGARHYFDHELLEDASISVRYIQYSLKPYPQLHGAFTPYVSMLDLIANCGAEGIQYLGGTSVSWQDFLSTQDKADTETS